MSQPLKYDEPSLRTSQNPLHEFVTGSTGGVVLVVLVLICYAITTQFGYIWDDDAYVFNNPLLKTFEGLSRIWTEPGMTPQYYPVTFTSFWLEVQTIGLNAKLSHVINMALHAGSVLILWQILRKLTVPGAWLAAAVFAVHPINVETVAWISERKNTLSLLFGLCSAWLYLRYAGVIATTAVMKPAKTDGENQEPGFELSLPNDPNRIYALFLLAFVLALLSKTTVAVFPVVFGLILWWKKGRLSRADIFSLIPPLALGAIAASVTSWIEHNPLLVGASGPDWNVGWVSRVMLAGQTACWYAWKMVWPHPLIFNYPKWTLEPTNPLQWLPLAIAIAAVAVLWAFRKTLGRGPITGLLIYLVCLLPTSGLFMVYPFRFSWVADHFAYVASIPLIALIVAGMVSLLHNYVRAGIALTGVVLLGFCVATNVHDLAFLDVKSLWETTLHDNPRSWMAEANYGAWSRERAQINYDNYMAMGDEKEAVRQRDLGWTAAEQWLQRSIRSNPKCYEAYCSLGLLKVAQGKYDEALRDFNTSDNLAVAQGADGYLQPKFALADLLAFRGQKAEAESMYAVLESYEPKLAARAPHPFALLHTQIGDGYMKQLKSPVAPEMPDADRATLQQAMDEYIRATEIAPDFIPAKLKLASILLDTGATRDGLQQVNDVLDIDKNNVEAKVLTANAAIKMGSYEFAVDQLANLLQVAPGYLPAHVKLAEVYKAMGRTSDAIAELEMTLKAAPGFPPAVKMLAECKAIAATQPTTQSVMPAKTH